MKRRITVLGVINMYNVKQNRHIAQLCKDKHINFDGDVVPWQRHRHVLRVTKEARPAHRNH